LVPVERDLGFALRPQEAFGTRGRGSLAVEALGFVRLGAGGAEQHDLAPRPALGHGRELRQVVDHLAWTAGTRRGGERAHAREHETARTRRPHRGRYLTFVPGGTSFSKPHKTALPSSAPASTMPWDSTPMSFAGL